MIINTDKVFDVLPYAADIIEKLDLKNYAAEHKVTVTKNQDKAEIDRLANDVGVGLMLHLLRNAAKVKTEIMTIIAIVEEKTVDEVMAQPFTATIQTIKDLFSDPEIAGFFKSAMR